MRGTATRFDPRLTSHPAFDSTASRLLGFGLPVLLTLALSIWLFQGLQATDDLRYAQLAISVLHDTPPDEAVPRHQWARVGVYFPVAGLFALFGVHAWTISLLPLVCSVLTAPLVVALGRRFFGPRQGYAAGFLFAVFPTTIQYATILLPEPIVVFEICLAAWLFAASGPARRGRAGLAGLLVGCAYLTSESGALMLPILLFLSWYFGRSRAETWALVAGFAGVVAAECLVYGAVAGNPIYRYTELSGEYTNDPMLVGDNVDLVYRAFRAYPDRFLYPSTTLGLSGWLMVTAGLWGLLLRFRSAAPLLVWAGIVFGFFNFMTASLERYVMLPVSTRLLLPGCVPLVVLAGALGVDIWDRMRGRWARAAFAISTVGFAASCVAASYLDWNTRFTAVLARNAEGVADRLRDEHPIVLISDTSSAAAISFFRGFDPRDTILDFDAGALWLDAQLAAGRRPAPFYVLLNGPTVHEFQITGGMYGGNLSLSPSDRAWIARVVPAGAEPEFEWQFQRGALFDRLFRVPRLRALFKDPDAIERRFAVEPAWARARLLRLPIAAASGDVS